MIGKTETIHTFNQQCFIVTGGAQGLGGAITRRLTASNAKVAIWDIDADASALMKKQLGSSVEVFEADISNETSVAKAMANTIDWSGVVHGLVNSAGIAGPNAPLADYPIDAWRQIMQINRWNLSNQPCCSSSITSPRLWSYSQHSFCSR